MVKFMEEKKTSSLNFLLIFFLSYSFYTFQILTQQLFKSYSKESVLIICILFLLSPIITFFICKIINKNKLKKNTKNHFLFSILTSLYLILTTVISIVNIVNIIILYYYQQTSIIILLIFLTLPLLYTLIKGENNFFSLASILLIIFIFFKYAYLKNSSSIETYVFYNILKINKSNIVSIIILASPILLEPLILLNNQKDMSDKINIKFTVIFSSILSLIGILTILRQTWEFGNLLGIIRFPYLESAKNIVAGKFFENIDYYYLLSLSVSVYTRLGFTVITTKKSFKLNNLATYILLFLILVLIYFMNSSMQFANYATNKILIASSLCLILLLLILPLMLKRGKKNA